VVEVEFVPMMGRRDEDQSIRSQEMKFVVGVVDQIGQWRISKSARTHKIPNLD